MLTGEQIHKALTVCRNVALVYAAADESNGGSQRINWEAFDEIAEMADEALGPQGVAGVIDQARAENDYEDPNFYVDPSEIFWRSVFPSRHEGLSLLHGSPECAIAYIKSQFPHAKPIVRQPAAVLTVAERKKADDTEGGACD